MLKFRELKFGPNALLLPLSKESKKNCTEVNYYGTYLSRTNNTILLFSLAFSIPQFHDYGIPTK